MPPVGAGCQLLGPHPRLRVKLHDARAGCRCYAADGAHVCVPNAAVMTPSPTLLKRPHGWCPPGPLLFGRRACGPTPGGPLHVTSFEPSIISAALTLTDFVMGASQPRLALPVLLLILLSLSSGSLVSGGRSFCFPHCISRTANRCEFCVAVCISTRSDGQLVYVHASPSLQVVPAFVCVSNVAAATLKHCSD